MLTFCLRRSLRAPSAQPYAAIRYFSSSLYRAKTPIKLPPKPAPPASVNVSGGRPWQIQMLARRMLDAGRDEIYRNTASRGFIGASLGIMAMSYCGIGYLYSTRLWDLEVARSRELRWFVPVAYQITMVCWGIFAAYALSRTWGIVRSIKLVQGPDKILLETLVRRPIPFMKPEKILSDPHTLIVNRTKLFSTADSEGMIVAAGDQSLGSRITKTLFYAPFHNTRKALGGVGLVPIKVGPEKSQRHFILDSDGQFSNEGKDLLDLSVDEI